MRLGFDETITIRRVVIDGERLFEAKVAGLPNCVEYAATRREARELAEDSIEVTKEYLDELAHGHEAPLDTDFD